MNVDSDLNVKYLRVLNKKRNIVKIMKLINYINDLCWC